MIDYNISFILGFLIILFSGMVAGLTGFGYALVSVPLLILFLPPKLVVSIILLLSFGINVFILLDVRKSIDIKRVLPLIISGIVAMPFGVYLLKIMDVMTLKVFIGCVIALFGIAFLSGFRREVKNEKLALIPVGLASGLLNGSIVMCGPPIILFFTNQGVAKHAFRANLVIYFTLLNIATIPVFFLNGLITGEVVKYSLIFLPAVVIGVLTGIKLSHRIKEKLFRKLALIIVTIAGLISIVSGLGVGI